MKTNQFLMLLILIFSCFTSSSQNIISTSRDSSVTIKVFGACEMCKARIETVVKGKGVKTAVWNVSNKMLRLDLDPSKTTLEKIEKRILLAGHDVESFKANNKVYEALPACCHYREQPTMPGTEPVKPIASDTMPADTGNMPAVVIPVIETGKGFVKGVVLESDLQGHFKPLRGASVMWVDTKQGTTTDSNGVFQLKLHDSKTQLAISHSGYKADTINVSPL